MVRIVLILLAGALLFILLIRSLESKFIFFPVKYPEGRWAEKAAGREDHFFAAEDGVRLHGWFFPREGARATVLLLHGNAGNISHRIDLIARIQEELAVEVFIFDYRGYGRSEGKPSENGVYADARAAYAFLHNRLERPPARIVLWGRSLGGAVAVDLAQHTQPAALVLESTFTTAAAMSKVMFGIIPVRWFMTIKFDSADKIRRITVPKLIMHGTADEVIPSSMGEELYGLAAPPKKFLSLPGAGHDDTYETTRDLYFSALRDFIGEWVR